MNGRKAEPFHCAQPCTLGPDGEPPPSPPICEVVERAMLDERRGVGHRHRAHAYGMVGIRVDPSDPANSIDVVGNFPQSVHLPDGQPLDQFMLTMLAVRTLQGIPPDVLRRVQKLVKDPEGSLLDVLSKLGEPEPDVMHG